MDYTLTLYFLCTNGKKTNLTVEGVKPDISDQSVTNLMQYIIDSNIFTTTNGALAQISAATLTARKVTNYLV